MSATEQKDTRTATQRLDDLEKVTSTLFSAVNQITQALENLGQTVTDVEILKRLTKLLNEHLAGVISLASETSGISRAGVDKFVVDIAIKEMQEQIKAWLDRGLLTGPVDSVELDSFVVAEELNTDGTLANARVQFNAQSQKEPYLGKLLGAKAGDLVVMGENKFSLKIQEIYKLNPPKAPEAAAPAEPTAAPVAETAPTATTAPVATEAAPTTTDSASS